MLRAVPASWFSWDFRVFDHDKQLAHIDMAWIREAGTLVLEGASYKVAREGFLGGAFVLEKDGQVITKATNQLYGGTCSKLNTATSITP